MFAVSKILLLLLFYVKKNLNFFKERMHEIDRKDISSAAKDLYFKHGLFFLFLCIKKSRKMYSTKY